MMNFETPEGTSLRLRDEHRGKTKFKPLSEDRRNMAFALAVQDASISRWYSEGQALGGWKIGLTSKRMQALCGVDEPVVGAMLANLIRRSPATLEVDAFGRLGLEMELAVSLASVPGPGEECTAESLRSRVGLVAAAFEVVDDRGADYAELDACSLVADNSWNEGVVLGEALRLAPGDRLLGRSGVLTCNGQGVATAATDDAGGDPLAVVAWLIPALRARGHDLLPGQWVMTGSVIPTIFAKAGETYHFKIEGFPAAETVIV